MRKPWVVSSFLVSAALLGSGALASFAFVLGATSTVAHASLAREATLQHLVTRADLVMEGVPEESLSLWEDIAGMGLRIVTYTRVRVGQTAYGDAKENVWVRTLGGNIGPIGQLVEGEAELVHGQHSVLFLRSAGPGAHLVVEMAQGCYRLNQVQDGTMRLHPTVHPGGLVVGNPQVLQGARSVLARKPLQEAFALILSERKAAGF